jgi:hypothetical protein
MMKNAINSLLQTNSIYKLFIDKNIVVYFLKNKKNDLALKKLIRSYFFLK